mmetsp:Transcript_11816/g.17127  ORF Transcript_11816/g.17127 Transcript_11816/m.17127 type:complete len:134 (-) Transcript_11816:255-656(-)
MASTDVRAREVLSTLFGSQCFLYQYQAATGITPSTQRISIGEISTQFFSFGIESVNFFGAIFDSAIRAEYIKAALKVAIERLPNVRQNDTICLGRYLNARNKQIKVQEAIIGKRNTEPLFMTSRGSTLLSPAF